MSPTTIPVCPHGFAAHQCDACLLADPHGPQHPAHPSHYDWRQARERDLRPLLPSGQPAVSSVPPVSEGPADAR
jgi:hypothetical protein